MGSLRCGSHSIDHGYYLVSDYSRLGIGQKSISWRYCWFEKWVLDDLFSLDWRALCEEREISERKILERQIKSSQERSAQIANELSRLLTLAKSSDSPPQTLLQEIRHMKQEQNSVRSGGIGLQVRIEATVAKEDSFHAKGDLIKELAPQLEQRSRIRLRQVPLGNRSIRPILVSNCMAWFDGCAARVETLSVVRHDRIIPLCPQMCLPQFRTNKRLVSHADPSACNSGDVYSAGHGTAQSAAVWHKLKGAYLTYLYTEVEAMVENRPLPSVGERAQ